MGRKFIAIGATIALSIFLADTSSAQRARRAGPNLRGGNHVRPNHQFRGSGQERLYRLSPEERQTFKRNAERWLQMDPQQRQILRERERVRRQQMTSEAESAMRDLGLRLDPNSRSQFEARYLQERRRIERALRQEAEAKRQRELPQLKERLKNEFQRGQGSSGAGSSPNGSAKPRK